MRSTAVLALLLAACQQAPPASDENVPTLTDLAWLSQPLWDDGKIEVATYEGWVEEKEGRRHFGVTTELTKHDRSRLDFTIAVDRRKAAASFAARDLTPLGVPAPDHFPAIAVPLFIRAVDFSRMKQVDFSVMLIDGTFVDSMTELLGSDREGERIAVYYAHAIDSTFGPRTNKEIYVRAHDAARTLLRLEVENRRYGLSIVKSERTAVHP